MPTRHYWLMEYQTTFGRQFGPFPSITPIRGITVPCLEFQNVLSRAGAGPTFANNRISQPSQYHQPRFPGTYQGYGRPPLDSPHVHSNQHGPRVTYFVGHREGASSGSQGFSRSKNATVGKVLLPPNGQYYTSLSVCL